MEGGSQVELPGDDADRAGQAAGVGEDLAAADGNVVPAGGGDASEAGDDGLLLVEASDGAPDRLAGHGAAAGAVDPQHDGLDAGVFAQLVQDLDDGASADAASVVSGLDRADEGDDRHAGAIAEGVADPQAAAAAVEEGGDAADGWFVVGVESEQAPGGLFDLVAVGDGVEEAEAGGASVVEGRVAEGGFEVFAGALPAGGE